MEIHVAVIYVDDEDRKRKDRSLQCFVGKNQLKVLADATQAKMKWDMQNNKNYRIVFGTLSQELFIGFDGGFNIITEILEFTKKGKKQPKRVELPPPPKRRIRINRE